MQIAIIENGSVKQIGDYKQLFPNVSFPATGPDEEFMDANECALVTVWKSHDNATQKLVAVDPYIEDGQVYTVAVIDKTQEELDLQTANVAMQVRGQRNGLLSESDWTQVEDAPVNKAAWAAYRQALRDITNQEGFPLDVTFPAKPE